MTILDMFKRSAYRSIKQDSYFPVYDKVLSPYKGTSPTLVEVGILSGGSLFMWREFLGEGARIIGVELNPEAVKWRDHGFEIFIGDQSSDAFWTDFFAKVGPVDILIDDGGHTNFQQLKTLHRALENTRDGGCVLIEDTHASYMKSFGNPSRYSFMNFCAQACHRINDRYFYKHSPNLIRDCVHSMEIFEGISAFKVDRRLCTKSRLISNAGLDDHATDMRVSGETIMAAPKRKGGFMVRRLARMREKWTSYRFCRQFF